MLTTTTIVPALLTQRELAAYLGKTTRWLERARVTGEGPTFVKVGRHVRYKAEDVLEYLEAGKCRSTRSKAGEAA